MASSPHDLFDDDDDQEDFLEVMDTAVSEYQCLLVKVGDIETWGFPNYWQYGL